MLKINGITSSEIILEKIIEAKGDMDNALNFVKGAYLLSFIICNITMILTVLFLFLFPTVWGYIICSILFLVSTRAVFRIMKHSLQSADYLSIMFMMFYSFAKNNDIKLMDFIESMPEYYKYSMGDIGSFYLKYRKLHKNEQD